jgi:hypothetical protein
LPASPHRHLGKGLGTQIEVVSVEVFRALASGALDFRLAEVGFDGADDVEGQFILQFEDVAQRAVVALGPDMRAGFSFDQLRSDADPVAGPAQTAFENIAHAQLAAGLLHVDGAALVDKGRVAGDHEQPFDPRQPGDDVLDDAVDEILLLRVRTHIVERQHPN